MVSDCRVNYSPESQQDLESIYAYVKENFYADEIARKSVAEILDCLIHSPYIGIDFDKKIGQQVEEEFNTRMLILGKNLVFYLVNDDAHEVYILRVLNAKQDYMRFINSVSKQVKDYSKLNDN